MGWHGVDQTTDFAHDRNAAVAHGIELTDPAGLEATGHQERITAGIDQARQGVVVGENTDTRPGWREASCQSPDSSPRSPVPSTTIWVSV